MKLDTPTAILIAAVVLMFSIGMQSCLLANAIQGSFVMHGCK